MPTVIIAHCATPATWPLGTGYFDIMVDALLGEFRDATLYVDTSALAIFSRARWLKQLANVPEIHHKLVYGSDFPVPPTLRTFRSELGDDFDAVAAMPCSIDRDVAIKQAIGLPESHFTRAGELLGHSAARA